MGPPRKIDIFLCFFGFFRSMEKMASDGPKWGQEDFCPTNPDLANILGSTDFDFENFHFLFIGSQISRPGLGRAWAESWAGPGLLSAHKPPARSGHATVTSVHKGCYVHDSWLSWASKVCFRICTSSKIIRTKLRVTQRIEGSR